MRMLMTYDSFKILNGDAVPMIVACVPDNWTRENPIP
jgi:hypothetical protein